MKTTYYDKVTELPKLGSCPWCGEELHRLWGSGWDYDHAACPCGYDKELQEMTGFEFGMSGRIYHNVYEEQDFEE